MELDMNNVDDDDDDDDDFFGNQDDDDDNNDTGNNERHGLAHYESRAREEELKTIGYLDSYDVNKEALLQDGFEQGYRETYDTAMRIGTLLGQISAQGRIIPTTTAAATMIDIPTTNKVEGDTTKEKEQLETQEEEEQQQQQANAQSQRVIQKVYQFLTTFESNKNGILGVHQVPTEMEDLERDLMSNV